jgi:HK97 family phage prohead protease
MSEKVMNKIKNGREYRQMVIEPVEGVTDQIVEGYATTFNQPYTLYSFDDDRGTHAVREQVAPDAFKEADMSDVIMQYDHAGRVFARLSNGTLALEEDEHGLKVRANLGGTEIGRQLFEEIQGGYTSKMSFGFTVAEDDIVPDGTDYLRTIKRIGKLYDVSAVSLPANDFTEISARSHCDGVIAEIEAERLRAEKEAEEQRQRLEEIQNRLKALKGETHGD